MAQCKDKGGFMSYPCRWLDTPLKYLGVRVLQHGVATTDMTSQSGEWVLQLQHVSHTHVPRSVLSRGTVHSHYSSCLIQTRVTCLKWCLRVSNCIVPAFLLNNKASFLAYHHVQKSLPHPTWNQVSSHQLLFTFKACQSCSSPLGSSPKCVEEDLHCSFSLGWFEISEASLLP